MDNQRILGRVKADNVQFVSLQFPDVTGGVKNVDIPANRLTEALDAGVWFDGPSIEGFARIQESDNWLRIDPSTYAVLPLNPSELQRAWVICDIFR